MFELVLAPQARVTLCTGATPTPVNDCVVGALVALLVNVRLAFAVPLACGLNVTVKPADWPADSVVGSAIPESTNSLVPVPPEETVTDALLALMLPVRADVAPTVTFPKLKLAGVTVSCPGVVPVPESEIASGELDASETNERLPVAAPVLAGPNLTVNVTLWPAVSVVGIVRPVMENPDPVTFACEILTVAPPVLVRVSDKLPV